MATAVMVASGKGGTGKTSLTAGVGSCLAALGRRVLCVDMDIGLRNLDLVLGLSDRAVMDFSDVMAYRCPLLSAAVEQPEIKGLFLLTAPLDGDGLEGQRFREVVEEAKDTFDYVFMDSRRAWASASSWPGRPPTGALWCPPWTPPPCGTPSGRWRSFTTSPSSIW